ncbi:molybdopterin synthase small subunit [Caulifigura coniformis]|uniref:Molybdopterin synthase sulfur carrier subunit n=1 Tax=Caulifigura coniformis TaxID=2527983 RepID=A0A517SBB6_9PLAN|nr:MoaD/ThiS family protein [Caulifigura coniformis]QDT53376.1 molybdopterin synthase small subunit [Caulifigura coniformis]
MIVRILFFAKARDLAGAAFAELRLEDGATVADLRRALGHACPALAPVLPRMHVAINNNYAADPDAIPADAEIACFPPVSGG